MEEAWRCCTKCSCVLIMFGLMTLFLGAFSLGYVDVYFNEEVKKRLVMKPGSPAFISWKDPPSKVYLKYYIFNYTNVDKILLGHRPKVTQLGPYSYRADIHNEITDYNEDNITYLENYSFYFDPSTSCESCQETDFVYSPSSALLAILRELKKLNITEDSSFIEREAIKTLNGILHEVQPSLFNGLTVYEVLWGYHDKLLEFFKTAEEMFGWLFKLLHLHVPRVSTTYIQLQMNTTQQKHFIGNITILTGQNIANVQRIIAWRGLRNSPYWLTKYANMLNGTDGSRFRPFLSKQDVLYVFPTYYCRSFSYEYESKQSIFGISLYRYALSKKCYENASANPDNAAFCVGGKCWPAGVFFVGECVTENITPFPPVFMSQPHFYLGDAELADNVIGLSPDSEKHSSFVDVEPLTGLSMNSHQRVQINYLATKVPLISFSDRLFKKELFMPIMYLESVSSIDKKDADNIKNSVLLFRDIIYYGQYCSLAAGGSMIVIALILIGRKVHKAKQNKKRVGDFQKILQDEDEPEKEPEEEENRISS